MGFFVGWDVFRIVVWAMIVVWVHPRLLDAIGGEQVARWLLDHGWVRVLGGLPLGLLGLISVFEPLNDPRRRAARQQLADHVGGTLVDLHRLDPTFGIPSGPGVRVPVGRWSMVVGTWKSQGDAHTVASVRVESRSSLSFVARAADGEPAALRGLQQFAVGHAIRRIAEQSSDPRQAASAATLAYLAEPPISTGHDVLDRTIVLRSNQPDHARALLTTSALAAAVVGLDEKIRRWSWTLYPTATAGMAEMRVEFSGGLQDAEALRAVQTLMRTALEEMARSGATAG